MAQYAFVIYRLIATSFDAETTAVPMRDYTHDLTAMLAAIGPKTKLVFVANPNNPTGTMVEESEIEAFMDRVPDHVIVCFDEAYIELLPPARQPDTLRYVREGRRVIVLRTFSKTYGLAGLRIGYAVAPPDCVALLKKVGQPFKVNALALAAAEAALRDDAHVERTREMVVSGLSYLQERFEAMGLPYVPAVANFMLVEVGDGRAVFEALQREGVIVRPMDGYGLGRYVRVTVGTPAENEKLVEAMGIVLAGRGRSHGERHDDGG